MCDRGAFNINCGYAETARQPHKGTGQQNGVNNLQHLLALRLDTVDAVDRAECPGPSFALFGESLCMCGRKKRPQKERRNKGGFHVTPMISFWLVWY